MAVSDSKEFSKPIRKEIVDRGLLADAVSLHENSLLLDFAWGMQLPDTVLLNAAVNIETLGEVQIPVSLQDIDKLKTFSGELSHGRGCSIPRETSIRLAKEIRLPKVLFSTQQSYDIWSIVGCHLRLPVDVIDVEIKLTKLLLYEAGGHYKEIVIDSKHCGTFGTVILQLPVKGGHEGGGSKVEYNGRRKVIETHQRSDERFYLLSFYNCCEHSVEPITKGFILRLVFNLIWKNPKTEIPHNFPLFLHGLNEIQEVLKLWIPKSTFKRNLMDDSPQIPSKIELDDSANNCLRPEEEPHLSLYTEKTLMEDVFFFVLEEQYGEKDVPFHRLRGNDFILAQLLLNCPFIDLHIATVTHKRFRLLDKIKSKDGPNSVAKKDRLITVSNWKDSENISTDYNIKLNPDHQCVGPIRNLLTLDKPDRLEVISLGDETCENQIEEQHFFRRVLVIWPKEESFRISCSFGLNSLLDRMEISINFALPELIDDVRQNVKRDLKNVIALGCADPRMLWVKAGMEKGELTLRLLRMCIRLEAREEGLALLKLLGLDFSEDQKGVVDDTENFEGIQNEQVALAIAKFQCLFGWRDMAELIKRMISPHRITQQFTPMVSLLKYLLEVNCREGAKEVGNLIASSFANINQHFDTCVSCYIRLGNAERLQSLFSDIFRAPAIDFEDNLSKKNLLGILISSPVIWELATSSELGKSTMTMLAMYQLILLRDEPTSPLKVRRQKTTPGEAFLSELLSCLKFIGRLESNSYPVDSKYMSMVQPLLDQLGIQQLLDIMVDLLKSNEQPPTIGILRFLCKVVVSRMKANEVPDMLRRESILEAVQYLNRSEDKLLLRSFLEQVSSYEISGSWDRKFKYELFDALIYSSGIWDGLDSTSKLIVLDTCTTLVGVWIVCICRLLDSSSPDKGEVSNSQIFECVKLFFLAEKNRFGMMTDNGTVLQHLLFKLPLPQLMQLVLDLYLSESKSQTNIKQFPNCFVWYQDLCKVFFSRDFVSVVKKDEVENVYRCLLWMDDDQLWELFSTKNVEIQQGLVDSPSAFAAFVRIAEGWVERSKSWKEPKFTWKQPNAVVNGHPELEAFFRSPLKNMSQYFTSVKEAHRFADSLLEECKLSSITEGFNVTVTPIGRKSVHCSVTKNRSYHINVYQNILKAYRSFKDKFDEFLELWQNLNDRILSNVVIEPSVGTGSSLDDDVLILSPAKRCRQEIDVVDLSV